MEDLLNKPIGQVLADDHRTLHVFRNHQIDFCCQGERTIKQACADHQLDPEILLKELNDVAQDTHAVEMTYSSWSPELLAEYIEKKHHRYVEEQIPVLRQYLDKLVDVHGANHPELESINKRFKQASDELVLHMKKEELVLFPFIRKMTRAREDNKSINPASFGSVDNPISMMKEEHNHEGEYFREIREWSNQFTPPADGCNTYMAAYTLLEKFEEDLHLHIHLENNLLFPKALAMQAELEEKGLIHAF